ncbi:MAG: vitamin B12 dependent-methionine synthase activation domain-containing protein [Ignavibacteria bacterium]|jgi:hypothetical protein
MNIALPQIEIEKDVYEIIINVNDIEVSKKEIEITLGYSDIGIPGHFSQLIDEIILQLPQYCKIKAGYRLIDLHKPTGRNDGLYAGKPFLQTDKIVSSQLNKAEKAALFVCTIGPLMEERSKRMLHNGDPMISYLVDTVASVTVENTTDFLHDHIGIEMKKHGFNITNRYSPGYCNWSVSEQHLLFSLLPEKFCGITLNESALMHPIKSTSGIIGIGKNVKYREYMCDRCGVKDCTYRAIRTRETNKNYSTGS